MLRALTAAYDEALRALAGGDLEGCTQMLDVGEELLAMAQARPDADAELLAETRTAHARLLAVLSGLHQDVGDEIARVRQGRRALAGYGGSHATGDRVRSDG